jgi:hypothetical protein
MTQSSNLQKLLTLRQARLQRAESALARQHAQCEAARARTDAAAARLVTHRDRQREREQILLDELLGRAVTVNDIGRLRSAFAVLEEQAADLDRAEREADRAMRAAFELKHALAIDRNRRRREQDKMSSLVAQARRSARHRDELRAEAEQEDRAPRSSALDRP